MINLKKLLNEDRLPTPKDDTDVEEYVSDFQELVLKAFPKINGWKSSMDYHSGAVEWNNSDVAAGYILATPMWESMPILPVNIQDEEGDDIYDKTFKFIPTYDRKKDLAQYKKMMLPIFALAEKWSNKK